ncbi:MAG: CbiX/SirB N-terminal domain-containing protein [Curvibacter sp.]|jgi:sirohydrochlorin cobaltochelatase|nr:CbiX/SirB N-terminal domain-containing protein [Curvibacter sp.]
MNPSTMTHGLILFAHGSRDPQWRAPMEAIAARAAALDPQARVACAYLELMEPDLPACASAMVADGLTRITIVPMFLGVGRHAREDLPQIVASLRQQHPAVNFELRPAIGEDAAVVELLAQFVASHR